MYGKMKSLINGVPTDSLPACDRGFLYGDGFFTTALIAKGKILNWQGHWQRLVNSAERLGFPLLSEIELLEASTVLLRENLAGLENLAVLKIIITRGCGGQGYQPPETIKTSPNVIIQLLPLLSLLPFSVKTAGTELKVTLCQVAWGHQPLLAGIKHLNRLENVLARQELDKLNECFDQNFDEGIMLDLVGQVISGTQSNICLIKNKQIITPILKNSGVQGTLLARLKSFLPSQGWQWVEKSFDLDYLKQADEVFFCNAVRGIMPMKQLDEKLNSQTWSTQTWSTQQASKLQIAVMQMLMDETCEK